MCAVRLGDFVKKGQVLMEVQSTDVSGAFATYLKAVSDERLAKVQLDRAKLLYEKGATSKSQLEVAENNDQDAQAAVTAAEHQLRVLGVDKDHPSANAQILAPAFGVIIAQNVHHFRRDRSHTRRIAERVHHRRSVAGMDHLRRL